eukprot:gene8727-18040_t
MSTIASFSAFSLLAVVTRSIIIRSKSFGKLRTLGNNKVPSICCDLNPVENVKISCRRVVDVGQHVIINKDKVRSIASEFSKLNIASFRGEVAWDVSGWHYTQDVEQLGPLTCQFIFVLDALNFCFWPTPGLEYEYLAVSLKNILEHDNTAFEAEKLAIITEADLMSWFPKYQFPLLPERVSRLRELGQGLLKDFDGLAANLVASAENSAVRLVELLLRHFPGFRDTSVYEGRLVHFYKRAQILCGDLWAAYARPKSGSIYHFYDMHELTMFADYRVPQLLRALGILEYREALANTIDNKQEIAFGSKEEIELRAFTITAVEMLHEEIQKLDGGLNGILVIELDWLLWQKGEDMKDTIEPAHRTLTIYY